MVLQRCCHPASLLLHLPVPCRMCLSIYLLDQSFQVPTLMGPFSDDMRNMRGSTCAAAIIFLILTRCAQPDLRSILQPQAEVEVVISQAIVPSPIYPW